MTAQHGVRRRGVQRRLILLVAALCVQSCTAGHHHLRPSHTRAKLSHGMCSPPNNLFSDMGRIITPGADMLKPSADECLGACE